MGAREIARTRGFDLASQIQPPITRRRSTGEDPNGSL
jgi:hypothetical protein